MKHLFVLLISVLCIVSCTHKSKLSIADTIYINGTIITANDRQPSAEAVATQNGLILAVGDNEKVLELKGQNTKVIDLTGQTLTPGFIDAHSHFAGVGTQSIVANLLPAPDGPVNNIAELQNALIRFRDTSSIVKDYQVVLGFNYDDSQLAEKRHPTRHDLDAVSTELPVVIMHQSGHIGVYNSKALELMGISSETADPPGGVIEREADGKTPNGKLQENAHFMVFFKMIPQFTAEDLIRLYKAGARSYASNGFTTVQDGKSDLSTLKLLPEIAAKEGFDIDIISYADLKVLKDAPILNSDLMSKTYQNRFRIGGVKLTFDGSPQGKTAWFTQPYLIPPAGQNYDYSGYPAFNDEAALALLQLAYKKKWQLLVHTNGDAAIDQLINLVGQINQKTPLSDHRTVMIHGQFTRYDQVAKLQALGIFPALYPMHTFYWGDWHRDSVAGPERAKNISPTGWVKAANMPFTIHSDAPVTFPNSMRLIDSAVNRVTRTGKVLGENHKLSPVEAIKAMTIWAAYQHFEEDIKGSIEPGKQADFVVLDNDPTRISPLKIKDIKVLMTINDDKVIFKRTQ